MTAAGDRTPILVVDDEPQTRRLLRTSLAVQGYQVLEAGSGAAAIAMIGREKPEAVILDLGLPDLDGLDVIRRVRAGGSKVPIIVLSSRGDERGKVEAFDLGADDYVTKPFGMAELVARIRAAIRHRVQEQGGEPYFKSGTLTVDLVRRIVMVKGEEVRLSPKEYDILRLLVLRAGRVLTHNFLMQEVWGIGCQVQYLRIYVRQLRQKIEPEPERPIHIITETGVGYRLRVHDNGEGLQPVSKQGGQ
jgi:two-component system, OmpR family, KDP operon response regulator KdpE